jgi:heterodisulfide reductase subunit B2
MKKYALFLGCNIPARVTQYETSARAVLDRLGVTVTDIREFNCCGYPLRNSDEKAFLLSSAINLALAEQAGLDIITLCKCCFGSLRHAAHLLEQDGELPDSVRRLLANKGLSYGNGTHIKHFLSVLYHEVGVASIAATLSARYRDLNIATHYGCHALRPSKITRFDDPVAPSLFDNLVAVTGATSVAWARKLECCGAPILGVDDSLSTNLTRQKVTDGKSAGADFICSACPYCHLQFDTVQHRLVTQNGHQPLPSILYPQLLGLCMGIDTALLGLDNNRLDISSIATFIESGGKNAHG